MKVYDPVGSGKASGKAKGGVFSFNRGLATFKKYVIPVIQNTALQLVRKNRFSYLTKYWETNLTFEQCELWRLWSLPWADIYGHAVILTGINKFFICNETLLEAGKSMTLTPPTATPSEITATDVSDLTLLCVDVKGISSAEITAQSPFIRVEVLGDLESITYTTGLLKIKATGIPVSRVPLKKNWSAVYWYDCRAGFEGSQELEIRLDKTGLPPSQQGLRIQRFNKFGYWSGLYTYLHGLSKVNLIVNGKFDNSDNWLLYSGFTIHDGKAYGVGGASLRQIAVPVIVGNNYQVDIDHVLLTPTEYISVKMFTFIIGVMNATQHYTFTFTMPDVLKYFQFICSSNYTGTVDNVVLTQL